MNVEHHYTQWSDTYDTELNRTRDLDREVTHRELGKAHLKSIIELGCGTGKNTQFLATIAKSVLAIDFSEGMLKRARQKVADSHVTFMKHDLCHLWPADDLTVDLIVCNLVLEHIEDFDPIFQQATRVLKPHGRFFVCELHPFRQYLGAQAHFHKGEQKLRVPAYIHHVSDYAKAAKNSGFTICEVKEWWHKEDSGKPPRLVSWMFQKD